MEHERLQAVLRESLLSMPGAQLMRMRAPDALETRLYQALCETPVLADCWCSEGGGTVVFRWSWHRYHIVVLDGELLLGDADCACLLCYQPTELQELARDLKRAVERRRQIL